MPYYLIDADSPGTFVSGRKSVDPIIHQVIQLASTHSNNAAGILAPLQFFRKAVQDNRCFEELLIIGKDDVVSFAVTDNIADFVWNHAGSKLYRLCHEYYAPTCSFSYLKPVCLVSAEVEAYD